jgi:hypothetical protein
MMSKHALQWSFLKTVPDDSDNEAWQNSSSGIEVVRPHPGNFEETQDFHHDLRGLEMGLLGRKRNVLR